MNTLNMPGFNAEASFYRTSNHYRLAAGRDSIEGQVINPQMKRACLLLVAAAAASCAAATTGVGAFACAVAATRAYYECS